MNAKERPVWTHDPGALLAASVGGRYAGSAMTIRNDTAAGAGTQAIRWCVVCRQRTGASTDVHEAGYPAQAACRIVDATVTWGIRPAFWGAGPTTDDMHGLPDFGGTDA